MRQREKSRPAVACRNEDCWRPTRHAGGICRVCRGRVTVEDVGEGHLRAMIAFVAFQERAMRDMGLDPNRTLYGEVEDAFRRDGLPVTFAEYVEHVRRADGKCKETRPSDTNRPLHVVPKCDGERGRGRVPRLPGHTHEAVKPGHPPSHAVRGLPRRGSTDAGSGTGGPALCDGATLPSTQDVAGETAVLEFRQPSGEAPTQPVHLQGLVRLRRYWMNLMAGTVGRVTAVQSDGDVVMAAVTLPDRRVWVPQHHLEGVSDAE